MILRATAESVPSDTSVVNGDTVLIPASFGQSCLLET